MTYDTINNPAHYCEGRGIEPKDVMYRLQMNCQVGQAFKYISRAGRKDDRIEDLRKALFWIEEEIKHPIRTKIQRPIHFKDWLSNFKISNYAQRVCEDWKLFDKHWVAAYDLMIYAYTGREINLSYVKTDLEMLIEGY